MAQARLTQHAVGQGGLWSGELNAGVDPVRWIYDCGSNQADSLLREINSMGAGPIDLLFLSHLDNDHVNGIDLLLGACPVREVVLPYLERGNLLLVVGEELAAGRLTETFRSFIADPVAWLRARGVAQVTFVRPTGEDDDTPPDLPDGPDPLGQGSLEVKWSKPPRPIIRGWARGGRTAAQGDVVRLKVQDISAVADWVFIPQVHLPTIARAKAFQRALKVEFPGEDIDKIVTRALDQTGRRKLRTAYDTLSKDHNKITMSLYAGPYPSSKSNWTAKFDWHPQVTDPSHTYFFFWFHGGDSGEVGWLSSGDADLSTPRRRGAFLKFYHSVLTGVGVFILPHHGSAGSFDTSLLAGMPALRIGIAAAGPNGYGHPHAQVRDAVNKACLFIQVDEREPSSFTCTLKS